MIAARGETGLVMGGVERRLCLTLGALAEIEAAFGCTRMSELDARMRNLSAADLTVVLAALLRGGGEGEAAAALGSADVSPGAAAKAVAEAFRLGLAG
ncbi:MAG TPA: GTA-gp10 family protein [Hyphomonas sp.]|nr:gene transfer agent family protein [Hyphomonas sp.]MCA8903325.1 gene transfer agent family protein [Hyphomonas sp.]MCB9962242.1 gene transfer agent family protein [Hyphomonas sp.]HPE46900.1 GTA-gp10 family protein [Hyphomonas sp.]